MGSSARPGGATANQEMARHDSDIPAQKTRRRPSLLFSDPSRGYRGSEAVWRRCVYTAYTDAFPHARNACLRKKVVSIQARRDLEQICQGPQTQGAKCHRAAVGTLDRQNLSLRSGLVDGTFLDGIGVVFIIIIAAG